jgi:DNA-binding GntR family transcriptional regulator
MRAARTTATAHTVRPQFHRMIAEMSGNKLLDCFIQSVSTFEAILRRL